MIRRAQNVTVEQMARCADVSASTMARRLNESTDFRARELVGIAALLHVSVDRLLGKATPS